MLKVLGLIFLAAGLFFKFFPPPNMNRIYGHRSSFSMKNQDTWDEAQRYSANTMVIVGLIFIAFGFVLNGLIKNLGNNYEMAIFIAGIIIMLIFDEGHLRRIFNKDGTRKL